MGTSKRFSQEFKQSIVKKLLSRGKQTIEQFCEENGLAISTVSRWQSECANVSVMNYKKNKSKLSSENILKIISETYSLNEEDLGLYLRKNGLHSAQIAEWRQDIILSMNMPKLNPNKKDERDFKISDLEKNLRKKDAALAEVSALLILQKKANLLWPDPITDEAY
jgi:transposase